MRNSWLSGSLVDDLVHAAEGGDIDIDAIPHILRVSRKDADFILGKVEGQLAGVLHGSFPA